MSYIFSDLKTKLQTQIGDPNIDTTVTGDALNYTQQNVFNTFDLTLNSGRQTNSVAASTNTLATALPSDFQKVSALYITSPIDRMGDITEYYVTPKDFRVSFPDPLLLEGYLTYWTYWSSIEFANLADTTYTVKLDYIKSVPQLSDASDVPTIPQAFEELLMLGAKMRIFEQKEDFDYANQFTNRYADLLEAFTTRYSTRQVDYQVVIPGARFRAGQA